MEWGDLIYMIIPGAVIAAWTAKHNQIRNIETRLSVVPTRDEVTEQIAQEADARKEAAAIDREYLDFRFDVVRDDIKEIKDILKGK